MARYCSPGSAGFHCCCLLQCGVHAHYLLCAQEIPAVKSKLESLEEKRFKYSAEVDEVISLHVVRGVVNPILNTL